MADVIWNGSAGDGNWNTGANWVGGSRPANSDVAIINSTNQSIIGATVAETGLTVKITAGFGGTIGADAPLIFTNGPALIQYAGTGRYANFGCSGTVTSAKLEHSGAQEVAISSGTWTLISNSSGIVTIAAAAIVTTFNNVAGPVTAGYNGTGFTTCSNGGQMYTSRASATLNCLRGSFVHMDNGVTGTSNGTVNTQNGATYNKRSSAADTLVNVFPGGKFSLFGTSGFGTGINTATTINIWAGSSIEDEVPGGVAVYGTKNFIGSDTGSR